MFQFVKKSVSLDEAYCILCRDSFSREDLAPALSPGLCPHLWWCSTEQDFKGGGDACAGCSSSKCEGCVAWWKRR